MSTGEIRFEELDDSLTVDIDAENGFSAKRRIICNWEDWPTVADMILQYQDGTAVLHAPLPGYDNVYCTNINVVPFSATTAVPSFLTDPATQMAEYAGKAVMTLSYKTVLVDLEGTPFKGATLPESVLMDYKVDQGGEYMTFEASDLRWAGQPTVPVKASATKFISNARHVLTFYNVKTPPFTPIYYLKGCVNEKQFCGFYQETLLFEGAQFDTRLVMQGRNLFKMGWNMTYSFVERVVLPDNYQYVGFGGSAVYGWNHSWRGATSTIEAGWDKLVRGAGPLASHTYRSGDFSYLFNF